MPYSIRALLRKLAPHRKISLPPPIDDREYSIEELEARRLPAADIWSLGAAQGSSTGGMTNAADPIVAGNVGGDPTIGIEFEIDRDDDGIVDATGIVEHGLGDFTIDLRAIDGTLDEFEGALSVRARAVELDGQGAPVAAGEWVETEFFLFGPPPTLDGFAGSEAAGDVWTFTGAVGGAHAAGATIEFGGLLEGHTVQADSAGNFSLTVSLGEVDGTATAKVIDSLGQESDVAEFYCNSTDDPVLIEFTGAEGEGDVWTFYGNVTGPTSLGATVNLGGILAGQSVQVDSCGSFSVTLQLGEVDGMATAQAVDDDGRTSNIVEFYCVSQPDPPEPWQAGTFGGWEEYDDYWTFCGTISGEGVEGATITFGGVLTGYSAQVDANGNFSVTAQLGNIDGYATAEVVDPTGQTIYMESYCVSQPDPPVTWQAGSFTGSEEADDYWTFTGAISGEGVEGATITFGGVLSGYTAQVDAYGNFSITAQLGNIDGYATAEVVDPSGQTISMETYCVSQPDPDPLVITSFSGEYQTGTEGIWSFTGVVAGTYAAGATISFGGVLSGASVQADSSGAFLFTCQIPGSNGEATAIADNGGMQSAMVQCFVQA